jgi:hypothetical protein
MTKHILVAESNAVEGSDDEFNEWYDNYHIPQILHVPGFVSAHRFKLSETQFDGSESRFRYLVIYQIDGDAAETVTAMLEAAPSFTRSNTLHPEYSLRIFTELNRNQRNS